MLYYAGTCPRNDYKFFKYATAGSEDVAWFNPGGFRAELKAGTNWNILYYVDSTGAVAVQGISYSDGNGNKMLVSIPDDEKEIVLNFYKSFKASLLEGGE